MGVRVREISVLLGALLGVLALLALQTGAWGQPAGQSVAGEPIDASDGKTYVAGELIISYEESATEVAEENAVDDVDGEVEGEIQALDAEVVEIPTIQDDAAGEAREQKLADAKEELENAPGVKAVDYDYILKTAGNDGEPGEPVMDGFYYEQYGLDRPNFPAAWQKSNYGTDARVAIVDTGIAQDHPDFNYAGNPSPAPPANTGKVLRQRDFVADDLIAADEDGHGTHVAGTVGAATNNGTGVAGGCPNCNLLIAKALETEGGTTSDVVDAIIWSAEQGADVINLSLGGPGSSTVLKDAVDFAYTERNAVIVAAAGNDGNTTAFYPAAYPNVISVVATNSRDQRAAFSNYGGTVDVAAPGVGILSTFPGTEVEDGYKFLNGTSMASPHVASLAALLVAQGIEDDPTPDAAADNRTNTEIRGLILNNAKDLGTRGRDSFTGAGRINALKSLRADDIP